MTTSDQPRIRWRCGKCGRVLILPSSQRPPQKVAHFPSHFAFINGLADQFSRYPCNGGWLQVGSTTGGGHS